jgi:hypothetical protein
MKRTQSAIVTALLLSVVSNYAWAESSNRDEVRRSLERDGWTVIYGKNITEKDWIEMIAALTPSIVSGEPTLFLAWFSETVAEIAQKFGKSGLEIAQSQLENLIVESLKKKSLIQLDRFQVEAGIATYNRWETVLGNKIPLPNWHQFYIRIRKSGKASDISNDGPDPSPNLNAKTFLDANGGHGNIYWHREVDLNNLNALWKLSRVRENEYMMIPAVAHAAFDANGGNGSCKEKCYFNGNIDPANNNQVFIFERHGDYYLIKSKVSGWALDANGGGGDGLYFNATPDANNNHHLYIVRRNGSFYYIMPKLQQE